jgi:hypothetical protein
MNSATPNNEVIESLSKKLDDYIGYRAGKSKQRAFLNDRVLEVSRRQPEILTLRAKLLGIGGAEIVALPLSLGIDPFVPLLEKFGQVMEGRGVTYRRMEPSECHLNVARLWNERKRGSRLIGVGTGYALSDDGLWRGHSWGLNKRGIIETTVSRVKYFGLPLVGKGADWFCRAVRGRKTKSS